MFVYISPDLKSAQNINLPQALSWIFFLSDFRIKRSQLPVDRRPNDQIAYFPAHQFQCAAGAVISLPAVAQGLRLPYGVLKYVFPCQGRFFKLIMILIFRLAEFLLTNCLIGIQVRIELINSFCLFQSVIDICQLVAVGNGCLLGIGPGNLCLRKQVQDLGFLIDKAQFEVGIGKSQDGIPFFQMRTVFSQFFFYPAALSRIQVIPFRLPE
jgi:hypothetical protein